MLFILRKLAAAVLMPLPLVLLAVLAGGIMWRRGRPRLGRGLIVGSTTVLWLASSSFVAELLVAPMEDRFPAFPGDSVAYVVVLGAGHTSDPGLPITSVLNSQALYRLAEGIRLATAQPWTILVVSGYGAGDPRAGAEVYRETAVSLGFDSTRIRTEPIPRTTAEEARNLASLLHGRPFALVTSATHMPRAVDLFRSQGLDPTPAPTAHVVKGRPGLGWRDFVPSSVALETTRQGWYELLGRLAVALGA